MCLERLAARISFLSLFGIILVYRRVSICITWQCHQGAGFILELIGLPERKNKPIIFQCLHSTYLTFIYFHVFGEDLLSPNPILPFLTVLYLQVLAGYTKDCTPQPLLPGCCHASYGQWNATGTYMCNSQDISLKGRGFFYKRVCPITCGTVM